MSNDFLELRKQVEELNKKRHLHDRPHHKFARRVEKTVAQVFGISVVELNTSTREHKYSHARFVLFAALWQPYGFRSLNWLGQRYGGLCHHSVFHGINSVYTTTLKERLETVLALVAKELELEAFGGH